ncbi:MAG: response regulator transcription factor [Omnitrophica WOR_2 bacterium]
MTAIRILIIDDHPIIRAGIRDLIEREPDFILIGEASTGLEALQYAKDLFPDVVVLDMGLPGMSGTEVAKELKQMNKQIHILAFSAYSDKQYIRDVLKIGVAGYLIKDEGPERIVQAIRGVARGEQGWLSRQAVNAISLYPDDQDEPNHKLSRRENQVLEQVIVGKTNQEIAHILGISVKTAEKHLRNIFKKLEASSRTEAAIKSMRIRMQKDK